MRPAQIAREISHLWLAREGLAWSFNEARANCAGNFADNQRFPDAPGELQ